jgi:hypothetical protein
MILVVVSFTSWEENLLTERLNDKHEDVFNDQIFMITTVNFQHSSEGRSKNCF